MIYVIIITDAIEDSNSVMNRFHDIFKGIFRYIFASLFCMSRREHL